MVIVKNRGGVEGMAVLAAQGVGRDSVEGIVCGLVGLAACAGVIQGLWGLSCIIVLTDAGDGTIVG